jgi:hypothetical protein
MIVATNRSVLDLGLDQLLDPAKGLREWPRIQRLDSPPDVGTGRERAPVATLRHDHHPPTHLDRAINLPVIVGIA